MTTYREGCVTTYVNAWVVKYNTCDICGVEMHTQLFPHFSVILWCASVIFLTTFKKMLLTFIRFVLFLYRCDSFYYYVFLFLIPLVYSLFTSPIKINVIIIIHKTTLYCAVYASVQLYTIDESHTFCLQTNVIWNPTRCSSFVKCCITSANEYSF